MGDDAMDVLQLCGRSWGKHKGIGVGKSEASVEVI